MGFGSYGICVTGHKSRDSGLGLGLILLGRLGLGQPNPKVWDKLGLLFHGILESHGSPEGTGEAGFKTYIKSWVL